MQTQWKAAFADLLCIELQPVFNALHATSPSSQTTEILYASNQAVTGLMILVIWVFTSSGHRLIDKTMGRPQVVSLALRALYSRWALRHPRCRGIRRVWFQCPRPTAASQCHR